MQVDICQLLGASKIMIRSRHLSQYPRLATLERALDVCFESGIKTKYESWGCKNIAKASINLFRFFLC